MPKPLVPIGYRPILWHLMRYYAHFGHTEFVLCLGYRGDAIREYFLNYSEAMTNDFTLSDGGRKVELHTRDFDNWRITFVDTGLHSNIGQRLMAVRRYVENDDVFLANYSDGLADLPLDRMLDDFHKEAAIASFAAVQTWQSFHAIRMGSDNYVNELGEVRDAEFLINGGYFILRKEIFEYMQPGDELVEAPFQRLIKERKLLGFRHKGFWRSMDTLKDKITFDRMYAVGEAPWELWRSGQAETRAKSKKKS
jgi:glucose-1-phosphate cytidylyltransferase